MTPPATPAGDEPLHLDISLERARALHRVWRALNDGDCPKCHCHCAATEMWRGMTCDSSIVPFEKLAGSIQCPACGFFVTGEEIQAVEQMFAPAMDAAVKIFEDWRANGYK